MTECFVANLSAVAHEAFDEETVLINFERGTYFSLRGTAPAVWDAIQSPASVAEIVAALAAAHGPLPDGAAAQVSAMLDRLVEEGCVAPAADAPPAPRALPAPTGAGFVPPVIEAFHDLKELIAIDPVHETHEFAGWPVRPPSYAVEP